MLDADRRALFGRDDRACELAWRLGFLIVCATAAAHLCSSLSSWDVLWMVQSFWCLDNQALLENELLHGRTQE